MRKKLSYSLLLVLGMLVVFLFLLVQPVSACLQGCTPGFWKQEQKFNYWEVYSPDDRVVDVFGLAADYIDTGDTLLDALEYKGGRGSDGAARILLRSATATLLNSTYDATHGGSWHYWPWEISDDHIKQKVNSALATGNRTAILNLADWFDDLNNLGCPL